MFRVNDPQSANAKTYSNTSNPTTTRMPRNAQMHTQIINIAWPFVSFCYIFVWYDWYYQKSFYGYSMCSIQTCIYIYICTVYISIFYKNAQTITTFLKHKQQRLALQHCGKLNLWTWRAWTSSVWRSFKRSRVVYPESAVFGCFWLFLSMSCMPFQHSDMLCKGGASTYQLEIDTEK